MGVIYKLRQEVVDFILTVKKATPALGCRDLAKIVSQELHFHVSKSSVNAVLQEFGLSSPVGRRGLSGKKREEKKFEIPPERKKQIFAAMPQELTNKKTFSPLEPAREIPLAKASRPLEAVLPTRDILQDVVGVKSKKNVYENSGVIFLQAVQWEMAQRSILGKVIAEKIKGFSTEDVERVTDAAVFAHGLNLNPKEMIVDQKQLFWHLCGLDKVNSPKEILQQILSLPAGEDLGMKVMMELPAALTQVSYIKVFLEDGRGFNIDSRQISVTSNNVQSGQLVFLEKILELISDQLINNTHPLIFSTIPTEDQMGVENFSEAFYSLFYAFENFLGKKMVKISLFDAQDQEIVTFDTIPDKKRYFIAGLWPWQVKFPELLAEAQQAKHAAEKFAIDGWNEEIEIKSVKISFTQDHPGEEQINGRAVIIQNSLTGNSRMAILTNAPVSVFSNQRIAEMYLRRWPNLEKGFGFYLLKNFENFKPGGGVSDVSLNAKQEGSLEEFYCQKAASAIQNKSEQFDATCFYSSICDIFALFDVFVSSLQDQSRKFFFLEGTSEENKELLKAIQALPATMETGPHYCKIEFLLPQGKLFLYRALLSMAIKVFNESAIKDQSGRNVILGFS